MSESTQLRLLNIVPICRIMSELARVAGTSMATGNPIFGYIKIHEFIHIPHDDHVGVQKDDSLRDHNDQEI